MERWTSWLSFCSLVVGMQLVRYKKEKRVDESVRGEDGLLSGDEVLERSEVLVAAQGREGRVMGDLGRSAPEHAASPCSLSEVEKENVSSGGRVW